MAQLVQTHLIEVMKHTNVNLIFISLFIYLYLSKNTWINALLKWEWINKIHRSSTLLVYKKICVILNTIIFFCRSNLLSKKDERESCDRRFGSEVNPCVKHICELFHANDQKTLITISHKLFFDIVVKVHLMRQIWASSLELWLV